MPYAPCLACSYPDATDVTHDGVTLQLCEECLEVARRIVMEFPDPAPADIVRFCAYAAQGAVV